MYNAIPAMNVGGGTPNGAFAGLSNIRPGSGNGGIFGIMPHGNMGPNFGFGRIPISLVRPGASTTSTGGGAVTVPSVGSGGNIVTGPPAVTPPGVPSTSMPSQSDPGTFSNAPIGGYQPTINSPSMDPSINIANSLTQPSIDPTIGLSGGSSQSLSPINPDMGGVAPRGPTFDPSAGAGGISPFSPDIGGVAPHGAIDPGMGAGMGGISPFSPDMGGVAPHGAMDPNMGIAQMLGAPSASASPFSAFTPDPNGSVTTANKRIPGLSDVAQALMM